MREAEFNLIDEKWIPVVPDRLASLRDIFADETLVALGGNARQKIALLKLLLAIAQAACTPANIQEWASLGPDGVAKACLAYLEKWHDRFFLYGERPFLQMPVEKANAVNFASLQPEKATGNNPRLNHSQCERALGNAERALLLVTEMSMCLGGKRVDQSVSLDGNNAKRATAPVGPGTGFAGYLHTFLTGDTIAETIWLNLLTADVISQLPNLSAGLGTPPWEQMPATECCPVAERLRESLQGRLVPMARFCLFEGDKIHYTEGIAPKTAQDGVWDSSVAAMVDGKGYKMLWADPEKRPWRSLSALLSFLAANQEKSFACLQLETCIPRLASSDVEHFGIWSGGLRLSSNSGNQFISGGDDLVESEVQLERDAYENAEWFARFSAEMRWLEKIAKALFSCVHSCFDTLSDDAGAGNVKKGDRKGNPKARGEAARASAMFWEKAEQLLQPLVEACQATEDLPALKKRFSQLLFESYDAVCPQETPRQLAAWARCRPNLRHLTDAEKGQKQAREKTLLELD